MQPDEPVGSPCPPTEPGSPSGSEPDDRIPLDRVRPSFDEHLRRRELHRLLDCKTSELARLAPTPGSDELEEALAEAGIDAQKELAEYLGVAESTVSVWLKEGRMPRMARLACLLLRLRTLAAEEIERLEGLLARPRVIAEGDRFHVAVFEETPGEWLYGRFYVKDLLDEGAAVLLARRNELLDILDDAIAEFEQRIGVDEDSTPALVRIFDKKEQKAKDLRECISDVTRWKRLRISAEKYEDHLKIFEESLSSGPSEEEEGKR